MIKWFNQKFSNGIFSGSFARTVIWCNHYLSINKYWEQVVRNRLQIPDNKKNPPWVSELYLCASFAIGVVFVTILPSLPQWLARLVAIVALYRPFEIILFALEWIFVGKDPIHSYKRSLAGFIINIAEIVIFFAAVYLGFGFVKASASISTALYSSLRTTVTIGPIATVEPPNCWLAGAVIISQIVISYFLAIVVLAGVVGALRKRDVVQKD